MILLALLLAVAISAGCGSAGKEARPLRPPAVSTGVSYRAGAPIALPTSRPAEAVVAADALAVRTRWLALSLAPQALRPILSDATLIAAPRSSDPFRAAGQLSRGAQIVPAAELEAFLTDVRRGKYGRQAEIATTAAALPRGVTSTFTLVDNDGAQRVEIDLHRPLAPASSTTTAAATASQPTATPDDALQLSLALDDAGAGRERVLLAPQPMPPPARFAVVVPSHFSSRRVKAIVAVIELAPASDSAEHAQAVADCKAQLQAAGAAAGGFASGSSPALPAGGWVGLTASLQSMSQPATARAAMVYLAGETAAELFGDAALVAPDAVLAELATRVRRRLGDPPKPMEPSQLGWLLDVVTLEQFSALQASKKLPPELSGVLARYAGEAARNAGSLEELTRVRGRDQMRARIVAENFTYLEDASPAARVRAYDWLKQQGRAPAKYDPLGPSKERSAAIEAAAAAPATQATHTAAPGGAP